jgi:ubiquinone/menaquinone biosynthesis C-methylase UbiE
MSREQIGQLDRARDRFTRTATAFADFVLANRRAEAEKLASMIAPRKTEVVLDFACGPGTLARSFAPLVQWSCGVDVTPAMLERARQMAREEELGNFACCCGDATALPFAAGSYDVAVGSYCLHHVGDPAGVIREMARVLRPGGRLGLLDIVVPEERERAQWNNRIERVRDGSHTRTLNTEEMRRMVEEAGLKIRASEHEKHPRSYTKWMNVAGWKRGGAAYEEGWRLLESSIDGDRAGFEPRITVDPEGTRDIEIIQKAHFLVAAKL